MEELARSCSGGPGGIAEPKPPYKTLAFAVKLLEKKGYLSHKAYGKTHDYFPVISQSDYRNN